MAILCCVAKNSLRGTVWIGDFVETQLDDLLAEGGNSMVEPVPLLHDALCPEVGLHVSKPPSRVVRPKGGRVMVLWLFTAAIVCRVKIWSKACEEDDGCLLKSVLTLLRHTGRAVYLHCTAPKTQLKTI
jgi:hypothetical protein